ncbi:hypothetical protein F8M41_009942 [Gigaspora margarita]|uniref:Uncharacterized protein n=1 Tax=Gigaspora margarita TaxID=4874 RepID=A0A8H3X1F1_GIGMA|nr:hypothetical protein F8M41_009942 [Gigaspora margarita]
MQANLPVLQSKGYEKGQKSVIDGIRQRNKEKKLQDSKTFVASRNTTTPLDRKNRQELIQEMFSFMSSLKEKIPEVSNHATKVSETVRSRKSDISSLHGTRETLCYKNKIGKKKAKGLIYDEVVKQLNILRKKKSQDIGLPLPDVLRDSLCKKTQRALKIYKLFEKVGMDKIKYISTYSANEISKLTNEEILAITDHFLNKPNTDFTDNQDNSINNSFDYTNIPEMQVRKQSLDLAKVSISSTPTEPTKSEVNISTIPIALPQTSVSNTSNEKLLDEKIATSQASVPSPFQVNASNKTQPPISILPVDPEEKRKTIINKVLEQFPYLSLKYSNEYGDYFTCSVSCPICNKDYKKYNTRDNIEDEWGSGDYVNTKTYRLKCWGNYQNSIQIVTVKA